MIDKLWLRFRISMFIIFYILLIFFPLFYGLMKLPWHWIKDEYCEFFNDINRALKDW